jgi:hypothetical protein
MTYAMEVLPSSYQTFQDAAIQFNNQVKEQHWGIGGSDWLLHPGIIKGFRDNRGSTN